MEFIDQYTPQFVIKNCDKNAVLSWEDLNIKPPDDTVSVWSVARFLTIEYATEKAQKYVDEYACYGDSLIH